MKCLCHNGLSRVISVAHYLTQRYGFQTNQNEQVSFIDKMQPDAIELRNGVFEFQGFQRELIYAQKQLLSEYESSLGLK